MHILFDKLFATFQVETKSGATASVQFSSAPVSLFPSPNPKPKARALTLAAIPAVIPEMGTRGVTNMAAALPDAGRQNL